MYVCICISSAIIAWDTRNIIKTHPYSIFYPPTQSRQVSCHNRICNNEFHFHFPIPIFFSVHLTLGFLLLDVLNIIMVGGIYMRSSIQMYRCVTCKCKNFFKFPIKTFGVLLFFIYRYICVCVIILTFAIKKIEKKGKERLTSLSRIFLTQPHIELFTFGALYKIQKCLPKSFVNVGGFFVAVC